MSISGIGVIHGRFQPLHLGHMEYLLAGKNRCQFLVVGITNPDPTLMKDHPANPARSRSSSNPFTYYERMLMIRDSLLESGVSRQEFEVAPFPINNPELIKFYVPLRARFFVTVYDDWGRAKVEVLRSLGLDVEVMWERSMCTRVTTGTEVRKLIASAMKWEHLVPPAVARIIHSLELDRRLRDMVADENEN